MKEEKSHSAIRIFANNDLYAERLDDFYIIFISDCILCIIFC